MSYRSSPNEDEVIFKLMNANVKKDESNFEKEFNYENDTFEEDLERAKDPSYDEVS